ncbi:unnamed protein product [Caenorhabditis brenneri]
MSDLSTFHLWESLPAEMKLECIKKMNLWSRNGNIKCFSFRNRLDMGMSGRAGTTVLPHIQGTNFNVKEMELGILPPEIPENWFLAKCVPNSIEHLKFEYHHHRGEPMPLDRIFSYPSINNVRLWEITCDICYLADCVQMAKKWIETDAEIWSRMWGHQGIEYNQNRYFEAFECFKIIEKSQHRIRFETNNPKKHILMKFTSFNVEGQGTCRLVLYVVSADAEK